MSHSYTGIGWNRQKRIYDQVLVLGVLLCLSSFIGVGLLLKPGALVETLLIRGLGVTAFVLLHLVLSIGPLARLDRRWLPLLYNRRHMGVTLFVLALAHGLLTLLIYHGMGNTPALISLFTANTDFGSVAQFPFQPLGFFALLILFLMAATSHDFWLANLSAPVWKTLHMLVYLAYALLVAHVFLGFLQAETSPLLTGIFACGVLWIVGIHLKASYAEYGMDHQGECRQDAEGFLDVCSVEDIVDTRAFVVTLSGERVAVFKNGDTLSAVSGLCQHQNGPLGEGKIIDGFVTCPWHGYQYNPTDGRSPEPFTEKVPTFRVKVSQDRVWVHPQPEAAGTAVAPAVLEPGGAQ